MKKRINKKNILLFLSDYIYTYSYIARFQEKEIEADLKEKIGVSYALHWCILLSVFLYLFTILQNEGIFVFYTEDYFDYHKIIITSIFALTFVFVFHKLYNKKTHPLVIDAYKQYFKSVDKAKKLYKLSFVVLSIFFIYWMFFLPSY